MSIKTMFAISLALGIGLLSGSTKEMTLLNVSYDPTRELYQDYNVAFAKYWEGKTGEKITIQQSHGGSGKQARSEIYGHKADEATLAPAYDTDVIAEKAKLLTVEW